MDFGNIIGQVLGGGGVNAGSGEQQHTIAQSVLQMVLSHGGVGGFTEKLRNAGLGSQVDSWVGTGQNQQIDPEQAQQAIGHDKITEIAQHAGVPPQVASAIVAQVLPRIVDHLTPNGQVPQGGGLSGGIGGLLGKIGA